MSNKKTFNHIIKIVSRFTAVAVVLLSLALVLPASPVSADELSPNISLKDKRCVDNDGVVEIETPNNLDSYELVNTDTDDTVPDEKIEEDDHITVSDLSDGNYRFEATIDGSSETLNFTIDCDEGEPETVSCPFDSSDGTVVNFNDNRIRSDQNLSDARTGIESLNLSSGTYTVKLYGYDKHDDHAEQNQQHESYFLSFLDDGSQVAETDELGDLPDDSDFGERTKVINNFNLSSAIDQVRGVHAAYEDNSSPNSLNAACGAFEKEEEDEPDISLKDKRCVDNDGVVEIETPNGLDSYKLINTDTGNTVEDDTDGASAGFITISDLPDGDYRFEATIDGNSETLNFTIDCPETTSCPWDTSKENVYTFSDERLIAENNTGVTENEETDSVNVDLSAGTYDIEIFTNDSYDGRRNASQPEEQSYLSLRNNSGNEIAKTDETNELADNQTTATEISTDNVEVDSHVSKLVGVHAFFDSSSDSPNSHNFTCAKLDKHDDEKDGLTGSCSVSPDEVEPGEDVTFSSNASGGDSPYAFSWDLEDSSDDADTQDVTTSYDDEGTYDGTVTITDDSGEEITRTCNVRVDEDDDGRGGGGILDPRDDDDDDDGDVRGDRDEDFDVQCVPEKSSYLIGERATFTAEISGDIDEDDVAFDWSDGNRLEGDDRTASIQYTTAGTKRVQVEAEYDGDTESDTCSVQINRADAGVTLDDVPYTGPAETAKVIGFLLTLLLLALGGGYLVLKRREDDGIPVGIPTNQN